MGTERAATIQTKKNSNALLKAKDTAAPCNPKPLIMNHETPQPITAVQVDVKDSHPVRSE